MQGELKLQQVPRGAFTGVFRVFSFCPISIYEENRRVLVVEYALVLVLDEQFMF